MTVARLVDKDAPAPTPVPATAPAPTGVGPTAPVPLPASRGRAVSAASESASESEAATEEESALVDWLGNLSPGGADAPRPPTGGEHPALQDLQGRSRYDATLFSTAVATDGPFASTQPKAVQGSWASEAFDPAKASADLLALDQRLDRFPALRGSEFLDQMRLYVAAAARADDAQAELHMEAALGCLSRLHAFTIGNEVYARQGADVVGEALEELTDKAMSGVVLWSKLNKYQAIETVAGGEKGNSLEASAAGSLFDDLTFGMHYGSHAVLRKQWSRVSQNFVNHARGVVHAQVLEGIDPNSVLTTTEWPVISRLMREGVVLAFIVHFFEYEEGRDGRPGRLVEFGQKGVTHPNQWMTLPSVTEWNEGLSDYSATQQVEKDETGKVVVGADGRAKQGRSGYATRQNAAHQGENDRHDRRKRFLAAKARFVTPEAG